MEADVEYTARVSVKVDLASGDVVSVGVRATKNGAVSEVSVNLESETDQPDELFDRAQQLVDAAAPEGHGATSESSLLVGFALTRWHLWGVKHLRPSTRKAIEEPVRSGVMTC